MGILRHVQQYSTMHVYIVVVSFIGGENWSITEKHYWSYKEEQFEDTKGVTRSHKTKTRQCNGQKIPKG